MPLSPFLSAESRSDREFQWQQASQGSETTNPGRCKSPSMGTGGQMELGAPVVANAPWMQRWGARTKDGKGPGCTTALGSVCKDVPSAPPVLAWDPSILAVFPCCFTSLPLPHPSPLFSPRYSEIREDGKLAGECRGGDADGIALGLPRSFGSRSSLPWGTNSIRHKRGQFLSQATVSH